LARAGRNIEEKQNIYKELWNKIEEIHITLRADKINNVEFDKLRTILNSYILKNSLFIDEKDQQLSNNYLKEVYRFAEHLRQSNIPDAEIEWNVTGPVLPEAINKAQELKSIYDNANRNREELLRRIRKILSE